MIIVEAMFSRGMAGLERASLDYAANLAACGHQIHFFCPAGAGICAELQQLAVTTDRVVPHEIPMGGIDRLLLRYRLSRRIARIRPDAIVTLGAKATSRMARRRPRGVPLLASTQNASPRLMQATHLIALTQSIRKLFVDRGFLERRIAQVPNAVPARFAKLPRRSDPLHRPVVIGAMARLIPKKGIDVFLKGFRLALDQGLNATAVIGGEGPQRAELESLCKSLDLTAHVNFTGWVSDASAFYNAIDIFCVPSRDEPFGIVVLEGFAHGTPVVAAAVGGPRELIRDGVNGGLFESDDPASLASALLRIADPETAATVRSAAYDSMPEYYGDAVGKKLEQVIRAAINDLRVER